MRTSRFVIARTLSCVAGLAADWLTDGGNPQRTAWQKDEQILNKDNVKNLKIVWKIQLDNKPKEMHSLFPPLIVDKVNTPNGPRQMAIVAGAGDNIYAIDVPTAEVVWKKHFEYPTPARRGRPADPLCPGRTDRDSGDRSSQCAAAIEPFTRWPATARSIRSMWPTARILLLRSSSAIRMGNRMR